MDAKMAARVASRLAGFPGAALTPSLLDAQAQTIRQWVGTAITNAKSGDLVSAERWAKKSVDACNSLLQAIRDAQVHDLH